jgi:hypothetical protein
MILVDNRKRQSKMPFKISMRTIVKSITTSAFGEQTLIEGVDDGFLREWFKITEESK